MLLFMESVISIPKMPMDILNTNFRLLRHRIVTHKSYKAVVLEQDYWEEIITTYNVSRVLTLAGIFSKIILENFIMINIQFYKTLDI